MSLRMFACFGVVIAGTSAFTLPPAFGEDAVPPETDVPFPGPLAGHSAHGETFDDGPRQAAYLMPGTGRVSLPVSSQSRHVQPFINQGVGQLHGYWYFEAERSFRQAAMLDPNCAMAYWGMAMANVNNEKRAKGFIVAAVKRRPQASPREQAWIDAYDEFYKADKKNDAARHRQLIRRLETIVQDYPDELEAKAFLIAQIYASRTKVPIGSHQAVEALIEQVLAVEPLHPVHHYRIHLWDDEKAVRAVKSAALCGPAAPTIAHMWHMPGHTYSKLQRYADAAWQQEAAQRVDHTHMLADRLLPDQIHNYAHNQEWLVRDLNFVGRAREAVELSKHMSELPRHPRYNTTSKGNAQYGFTRLVDTLGRWELWDEALALADTPYLDAGGDDARLTRRRRLLGAAYFARGDTARGQVELAALDAAIGKVREEQKAAEAKAESDARKAKQPDNKVVQAKADAGKRFASRLRPLEQAQAELQAHAARQAGDAKRALEGFKRSGVGKEVLSRAHLAAGEREPAEKLAREAVASGKNQVAPLANLVEILAQVDKKDEAVKLFADLRKLAAKADLDLPVFLRLRPLIRERGLPDDWRLAADSPTDLGPRPELESLGPLRWRPWTAPPWSLPAADGRSVSLADYRGKPVIVIFYLGFGCAHCVQQLEAFGPETKKFQDRGISVVAVSSDNVDDLKQSLAKAQLKDKFPFPIVSDAGHGVFKAYRVYDDFEARPLHAVFLIDGAGRVRWQDISFEPFTDTAFLLKESQRLLAIPPAAAEARP